jgi:hypothetical protein
MTIADEVRGDQRAGRVLRAVALTGAAGLAVAAVSVWNQARVDGDDTFVIGDLVAMAVVTAVGFAVLAVLDTWALRGGEARVRATVVGLAVAAVLALPLLWWSPAPLMTAASVLVLARGARQDGRVRAARLTALVVVAATVAVWGGSALATSL